MTVDAFAWMRRRDVPAYVGDVGVAHPPVDPEVPLPLHMIGLPRLRGATGVSVNPQTIF